MGNKKFKVYKDKNNKSISAVFDFDRIQCLIMIDDDEDNNSD